MKYYRKIPFLVLFSVAAAASAPPEPGPEQGGLRLRFEVLPHPATNREGYDVRLDLFNVTQRDSALRAAWRYEADQGDLKDYIEAATSVETFPAIAPMSAQVLWPNRRAPQPEYFLKPGEVLSLSWHTEGRRLKNRVADPNNVQNPEFPFPGFYSVHATLKINVGGRTVLLRSNEQLIAIGGSRESPRQTYGQLWEVDREAGTARLGLGELHGIGTGDEFRIATGMREYWKLTITRVEPESSTGHLEPMLQLGPNPTNPNPRFPERHMHATLILNK